MEQTVFHKNAQTLRELYNAINITVVDRQIDENHYELWATACQRFHSSYDHLAFPGGLEQQLSSLKRGDTQAIEMAATVVRMIETA